MRYNTPKHVAVALLLLVSVLTVAMLLASAPAVAETTNESDGSLFDDLSDGETQTLETGEDEEPEGFAAVQQTIEDTVITTYTLFRGSTAGLYDRVQYEAGQINPFAEPVDVGHQANETVMLVNGNDDAIVSYLNNQTNAAPDGDLEYHQFTLVGENSDGEPVEETFDVGLEYDHDAEEYVTVEAARESTHEPDEEHVHKGFLAEETAGETVYLLENFVYDDEPIDEEYIARSTTRYGGLFGSFFESTLLGDDLEYIDDGDFE
ncbi:hypothetical protein [Natronosalvus amylolyticus]|uniref:hypothetical protein n=1 Tax=Natronosalvus amylolyticus TaxID=2961994 RepID=UPI0020C9A7E0|nr:hypothetical protein [Natronosalvus amylolyticus]